MGVFAAEYPVVGFRKNMADAFEVARHDGPVLITKNGKPCGIVYRSGSTSLTHRRNGVDVFSKEDLLAVSKWMADHDSQKITVLDLLEVVDQARHDNQPTCEPMTP